jgi:hypothetical protein
MLPVVAGQYSMLEFIGNRSATALIAYCRGEWPKDSECLYR